MQSIALFFLLIIRQSDTVHVCGNYCGPHWCAGMDISETDCDDKKNPETWSSTGTSCADACCKTHDICCGHSVNTSACNTVIIQCLRDCNPLSLSCTRYGIPVPAGMIEIGMDIVKDWCCGSPCTTTSMQKLEVDAKRSFIAKHSIKN